MITKPVIDGGGDGGDTGGEESTLGQAEALALGITQELLLAFPELQAIYLEFTKGNIAKARMDYFSTKFYKDMTATAQDRASKKSLRPGVYQQELDAWKQGQRQRLIAKGFAWNTDIEKLAEQSYLNGDSDLQLEVKILNSGKMGRIGGSTLGAVNSLKEYAMEQGISGILPKSYWQKVSTDLISGNLTSEDVEEELKNFAVSAYPAYAKGIQGGRSFNMQTSALRQTMANLLERDVDTITDNNPLFQKLVGYINPKTQQQEQIPLWYAEKMVKSTDEWLYTNNARNTFDNYARRVLKDMGLA